MGPGDHHCHDGQARIATDRARDKHDVIIVQEKLDGSCVSVANVDGQIVALGRSGYLAQSSKYRQHQLFAYWVRKQEGRFRSVLTPGERFVGEWLAQAHGTRYELRHEPFVVFDLMQGPDRVQHAEMSTAAFLVELPQPHTLNSRAPTSVADALAALGKYGHHGAIDPIEGAVWRVERHGRVDFVAKYVRPDKADGCFLPEVSGREEIWQWTP